MISSRNVNVHHANINLVIEKVQWFIKNLPNLPVNTSLNSTYS